MPKKRRKGTTYGYSKREQTIYTHGEADQNGSDDVIFGLSGEDRDTLVRQVQKEKQVAWNHMQTKWEKWKIYLSLYNNQRRDPEAIGDTTLFTVLQTILASMYEDDLDIEFVGREEGDNETAETLTSVAEYDADEMDLASVDLQEMWDSLFFGRSLVFMYEVLKDDDKKVFVPIPKNIDPFVFLRDPEATSVNGNRKGEGALRFWGMAQQYTKWQLEDAKVFKRLDLICTDPKAEAASDLIEQAKQTRDSTQGRQYTSEAFDDIGDNSYLNITLWATYWQGKRALVWLANDDNLIIRYKELEYDYWPINDTPIYPMSYDWDGVSLCDLLEDKQRARAIVANLGLNMLKGDMYPMYVYNSEKIENRTDLNFEFNKFIESKGEVTGAIMPVQKAQANFGLIDFIYNSANNEAQRSTAAPDIQQGIQSEEKRTLGEINLVASKADTRQSLSAKIRMKSRKQFWFMWYQIYKHHFSDSNMREKVIRIKGAFGPKWRGLTKDNLICKTDPDVEVQSRTINEAMKARDLQSSMMFANLIAQDPSANMRYMQRRIGEKAGMTKDELDRALPPTPDELNAEYENETLSEDKYVQVMAYDNHLVHLEYHAKANQTKQTLIHIAAHLTAIRLKQENPQLFPDQAASGAAEQQQPSPATAEDLTAGVPNAAQAGVQPGQPQMFTQ